MGTCMDLNLSMTACDYLLEAQCGKGSEAGKTAGGHGGRTSAGLVEGGI